MQPQTDLLQKVFYSTQDLKFDIDLGLKKMGYVSELDFSTSEEFFLQINVIY
jgi:hypothetical protein